jgi:hypothetical protein
LVGRNQKVRENIYYKESKREKKKKVYGASTSPVSISTGQIIFSRVNLPGKYFPDGEVYRAEFEKIYTKVKKKVNNLNNSTCSKYFFILF